jgi:hypothetical protein
VTEHHETGLPVHSQQAGPVTCVCCCCRIVAQTAKVTKFEDPGWWRTPGVTTAAFAEESDSQWLEVLDRAVRVLLRYSHVGSDGRLTGAFSADAFVVL